MQVERKDLDVVGYSTLIKCFVKAIKVDKNLDKISKVVMLVKFFSIIIIVFCSMVYGQWPYTCIVGLVEGNRRINTLSNNFLTKVKTRIYFDLLFTIVFCFH